MLMLKPYSLSCRASVRGVVGRWIDPLGGPIKLFLVPASAPQRYWCNKGRGMCYPVCGMAHIKDPLLPIVKE